MLDAAFEVEVADIPELREEVADQFYAVREGKVQVFVQHKNGKPLGTPHTVQENVRVFAQEKGSIWVAVGLSQVLFAHGAIQVVFGPSGATFGCRKLFVIDGSAGDRLATTSSVGPILMRWSALVPGSVATMQSVVPCGLLAKVRIFLRPLDGTRVLLAIDYRKTTPQKIIDALQEFVLGCNGGEISLSVEHVVSHD